MQLSLEGDAHLLGRLAQGSLVGMGVSGMEGVDANWGIPVTGLRSGRNYSIGILIINPSAASRVFTDHFTDHFFFIFLFSPV